MTETQHAKLTEAWNERLAYFKKAQSHQDLMKKLEADRFKSPQNSRVTVWFSAVASWYEWEDQKMQANKLRYFADQLWSDAVLEHCGNIRLDWDEEPGKGWNCRLETGEVFKS